MVYICRESLFKNKKLLFDSVFVTLIVFFALTLLPYSYLKYNKEKKSFNSNFIEHKTYQWGFHRAKLISTADPRDITQSINIIQKYSDKNNPRIFILSKYDNILPFLSERYSAMPFFEVAAYLFSDKESEYVIQRLKDNKPQFLFIDTDINNFRNNSWDLIYFSNFMNNERASRYGRYTILKNIFDQFSDNYKIIESSKLLTVYERKE
jgi:hypothetical protein